VNNKGKASKRRKPTHEVGALFCLLADTQGNDDEEEELCEAAFQIMKDDKKTEEEELPQSLSLTIMTCYLEQIKKT
jgi:hypothetical protein